MLTCKHLFMELQKLLFQQCKPQRCKTSLPSQFKAARSLAWLFFASFYFRTTTGSCESQCLIFSQHKTHSGSVEQSCFQECCSSCITVKYFTISISTDNRCLYFALCLLLQPGPCGFSEDQGLLNNHGWVFSPQKLHLHLLSHRAQLQGQISKCQTLLGTVAVSSRCGVADHLMKNGGELNMVTKIDMTMDAHLAVVPYGLIAFRVNIICIQGDIGKFPLQALCFYLLKGCFANKVSRLEQVQKQISLKTVMDNYCMVKKTPITLFSLMK